MTIWLPLTALLLVAGRLAAGAGLIIGVQGMAVLAVLVLPRPTKTNATVGNAATAAARGHLGSS